MKIASFPIVTIHCLHLSLLPTAFLFTPTPATLSHRHSLELPHEASQGASEPLGACVLWLLELLPSARAPTTLTRESGRFRQIFLVCFS